MLGCVVLSFKIYQGQGNQCNTDQGAEKAEPGKKGDPTDIRVCAILEQHDDQAAQIAESIRDIYQETRVAH